jgi:type IV secretory pathway VirB4 component
LPQGQIIPAPEKISSLKAILETILKEEDKQNLPKLEKRLLESEISNLYKSVKGRCPRFSDLKDRWEKSENPILKQFSTILYPWVSGTYGKLLNPEKSTISLSRSINNGVDVATFDLKGLSTKPELQKVMLLVLTDLLWQDIANNPGRLKLLILDECWQLLKSATDFIEECYRTFRKYGASIGAISQAIEDFKDSPIATAILNNAPTRFILSQKGDLSVLKEVLKLNDREVDLISSLSQKKGEYSEFFLAQNGHHILRLCPSPLEYHLSTTHHKDKKLEQEYREKYPELSMQELYHKLATEHPRGALN